jgi:chromosome segregation ATPase
MAEPAAPTAAQKLARRRSVIEIPGQSERALLEQEEEAQKARAKMKAELKGITRRVSLVQDDWGELEERASSYVKADGGRGDYHEVLTEGQERVTDLMDDVYDQGLDNVEALKDLNTFFEGQTENASNMRDELELLSQLQQEQIELDNSMRAIVNVEGSADKAQDTLSQLTVSIRDAIQHSSDMAREQGEREAEELRAQAAAYVQQMQDELRGTREKLLSSSKQISNMVKAQGSQGRRVQQLTNEMAENERIRNEIQKELAQQQLRNENLQSTVDRVNGDSSTLDRLQRALEKCEEDLSVSKKLLESKTEHVAQLQSDTVALKKQNKMQADELTAVTEKLDSMKNGGSPSEIATFKKKITTLTSENEDKDKSMELMEGKMSELQAKITEAQEKLRASNKEKLEHFEAAESYKKKLDKVKKKGKGEASKSEEAAGETAAAYKKTKAQLAAIEAEREKDEKDREASGKEMARRQSMVEDMASEMDQVKQNLIDLEQILRNKLEEREVDVSSFDDLSVMMGLLDISQSMKPTVVAVVTDLDQINQDVMNERERTQKLQNVVGDLEHSSVVMNNKCPQTQTTQQKSKDRIQTVTNCATRLHHGCTVTPWVHGCTVTPSAHSLLFPLYSPCT